MGFPIPVGHGAFTVKNSARSVRIHHQNRHRSLATAAARSIDATLGILRRNRHRLPWTSAFLAKPVVHRARLLAVQWQRLPELRAPNQTRC